MSGVLPITVKMVLGKKQRQLKLKEAFLQRNFQKYPIEKCVYESNLRNHVYEPPKYGREFRRVEFADTVCCAHCFLRPCIIIGKRKDFVECMAEVSEDPELALSNGRTHAFNLFGTYCGRLWMSRMKIKAEGPEPGSVSLPACVRRELPILLEHILSRQCDK